ncbi:MAG: type II toxin-antitoxin system HicB family antitoxin [Bacteroidetes bacterium]|nr:type II toxin-antitoxin system HicB family antitoxin [Bacteroidota bacterium]
MEKIIIIIGASSDHFGAYAENCDGIFGGGNTVAEAKENALEGLRLFVESRDKKDLPAILQGEYEIEYKYDVQSFLNYYNRIFTNVALERITGVNQKLLHHYATGLKKPRERQRKRIETALHSFGKELLTVNL